MTPLAAGRLAAAAVLVTLAVVLQTSVFPSFAWSGIVPDLVLLVVVAAALTRGGQFAMVLGFAGGLVLDLVPPADHLAGRWALALVVVGYVAGRVRSERDAFADAAPRAVDVVVTVAACSFVASSLFALSGLVLRDPAVGMGEMVEPILVALAWDVLLTPLVLPPVMALFRRLDPELQRG